jgi:hypothetical protein
VLVHVQSACTEMHDASAAHIVQFSTKRTTLLQACVQAAACLLVNLILSKTLAVVLCAQYCAMLVTRVHAIDCYSINVYTSCSSKYMHIYVHKHACVRA